jgi:1-deoxyxylulose-5-phosphate synthase
MNRLNRRKFIAATASAATCLVGTGQAARAAKTAAAPPQVPLGKTGITLSRLAQGTGTSGGNRQSNQTRLGFQSLVRLLRHGYDRGITCFDMADLYGSHVYVREALKSIPREKVTLLTKLWWRYDQPINLANAALHKRWTTTALQRFRHELGTDYLDIVLLHCLTERDWDRKLTPCMDALTEAKDRQQVRAVGVSCHDLGAMQTAAECPWVDVILARINPRAVKMDGTVEQIVAVLKKMQDNGKAVIGMKIFGEGKLVGQKDECIRYAQGLGLLDAMTIGIERQQQIDENVALLEKYPAQPVA